MAVSAKRRLMAAGSTAIRPASAGRSFADPANGDNLRPALPIGAGGG
jgi:hypothetical protein